MMNKPVELLVRMLEREVSSDRSPSDQININIRIYDIINQGLVSNQVAFIRAFAEHPTASHLYTKFFDKLVEQTEDVYKIIGEPDLQSPIQVEGMNFVHELLEALFGRKGAVFTFLHLTLVTNQDLEIPSLLVWLASSPVLEKLFQLSTLVLKNSDLDESPLEEDVDKLQVYSTLGLIDLLFKLMDPIRLTKSQKWRVAIKKILHAVFSSEYLSLALKWMYFNLEPILTEDQLKTMYLNESIEDQRLQVYVRVWLQLLFLFSITPFESIPVPDNYFELCETVIMSVALVYDIGHLGYIQEDAVHVDELLMEDLLWKAVPAAGVKAFTLFPGIVLQEGVYAFLMGPLEGALRQLACTLDMIVTLTQDWTDLQGLDQDRMGLRGAHAVVSSEEIMRRKINLSAMAGILFPSSDDAISDKFFVASVEYDGIIKILRETDQQRAIWTSVTMIEAALRKMTCICSHLPPPMVHVASSLHGGMKVSPISKGLWDFGPQWPSAITADDFVVSMVWKSLSILNFLIEDIHEACPASFKSALLHSSDASAKGSPVHVELDEEVALTSLEGSELNASLAQQQSSAGGVKESLIQLKEESELSPEDWELHASLAQLLLSHTRTVQKIMIVRGQVAWSPADRGRLLDYCTSLETKLFGYYHMNLSCWEKAVQRVAQDPDQRQCLQHAFTCLTSKCEIQRCIKDLRQRQMADLDSSEAVADSSGLGSTAQGGVVLGSAVQGNAVHGSAVLDSAGQPSLQNSFENPEQETKQLGGFGVHLHSSLLCCNFKCTNLSGPSEMSLLSLACGGGCGDRYCSKQCQAQAWRMGHRRKCTPITIPMSPVPDPSDEALARCIEESLGRKPAIVGDEHPKGGLDLGTTLLCYSCQRTPLKGLFNPEDWS